MKYSKPTVGVTNIEAIHAVLHVIMDTHVEQMVITFRAANLHALKK